MQSEKVWEAKTQSAAFCRNQAKEVKCSKAKAGYCPEEEAKNFDKSLPWFASIFKKNLILNIYIFAQEYSRKNRSTSPPPLGEVESNTTDPKKLSSFYKFVLFYKIVKF